MGRIRLEDLSDSLKEYLNGLGLTEDQVYNLINTLESEKIGQTNELPIDESQNIVGIINEIYNSKNDMLQDLVAALVAKGLGVTINNNFDEIINKIETDLTLPSGDAVASNVLSGKTFINSTGNTITGSMVNQGSKTFTPSASKQTGAAGYYSKITVNTDSNLKAENIKSGVKIFGVTGTAKFAPTIKVSTEAQYDFNRNNTATGPTKTKFGAAWTSAAVGEVQIRLSGERSNENITTITGPTIYIKAYLNGKEVASLGFGDSSWDGSNGGWHSRDKTVTISVAPGDVIDFYTSNDSNSSAPGTNIRVAIYGTITS